MVSRREHQIEITTRINLVVTREKPEIGLRLIEFFRWSRLKTNAIKEAN